MSGLRWDATAPGVREVYADLSRALAGGDHYLAGGTALALREGHRISQDLDVFAPSIGDPMRLAERLRRSGLALEVVSTAPETLYATVRGVQVSFIGAGAALLEPPVEPAPGLLPLASLDDIAAMKLAAVASRGSRKDFVDLWVLVSRHRSLAEYLELYRRKYAADTGHVLRSLVYFDDAEREPPLRLLVDVTWDRVKADFERWVDACLR